MFTFTMPESLSVTKVCLSGDGIWCTAPSTNWWPGVASSATAPLFNTPSGAVSFTGSAFTIFAGAEATTSRFDPGITYTASVTTNSGVLVASVTIGQQPPPTDTDGDGVPDETDQCDTQPGPAPTGCPVQPPADTDGDGVTDDQDQCDTQPGPPPTGCPVLPPQSNFQVTLTVSTCSAKTSDVPPDATGGWGVQFQRRVSGSTTWSSHGNRDTTAPYERTSTISAGTYEFRAIWSKTGQPSVTRALLTRTCGG